MWIYYAFEAIELAERRRREAERGRLAALAGGSRSAVRPRRWLVRLGAPVGAAVRRLASGIASRRPGTASADTQRRRRPAV